MASNKEENLTINGYVQVATVIICGFDNGKYLLGKRKSSKKEMDECWEFLGGKVLAGETIYQAGVREIKEECGIISEDLEILGDLTPFKIEEFKVEINPILFSINRDISVFEHHPDHYELKYFSLDEIEKISKKMRSTNIIIEDMRKNIKNHDV